MFGSTRRFLVDLVAFAGRNGIWVGATMVSGAFFEGAGLALIVPLIEIVSGDGAGHLQRFANAVFVRLGADTTLQRLGWLLGAFIVLMTVRATVIAYRDVAVAKLQLDFLEEHRLRVARLLTASSWENISRLRHARISHMMSGDIQRVAVAVNGALQCAAGAALFAVQCVLAFLISPLLAGTVFGLVMLGGVALRPLLRKAHKQGELVTNANLVLLDGTVQFLGGLKFALSQNLQASFLTEFKETLASLRRRQIAFIRQVANGRQAFATIIALIGVIAVLVGFGVLHLSAPYLIVFLLILARTTGPAAQIQQAAQNFVYGLPAFEMLRELEDELSAGTAAPPRFGHAVQTVNGAVTFEQVSYSHAVATQVSPKHNPPNGVRELDVRIADQEFIGIVGPSGSGKTTFADLLAGLITPQSGRIRVGSAGLCGAVLEHWRNQICYVGQEPFLFHDSIRRNLSWAHPSASEGQMWEALALCGADDMVRRMTGGLEAVVGERGSLMSGGERQRLALARAVLRKPSVLILDEATNAIDIAGETEIMQRLLAVTPRPTIVMIAHRTESLALCDRIIRLQEGRLATDRPNGRASTYPTAVGEAVA